MPQDSLRYTLVLCVPYNQTSCVLRGIMCPFNISYYFGRTWFFSCVVLVLWWYDNVKLLYVTLLLQSHYSRVALQVTLFLLCVALRCVVFAFLVFAWHDTCLYARTCASHIMSLPVCAVTYWFYWFFSLCAVTCWFYLIKIFFIFLEKSLDASLQSGIVVLNVACCHVPTTYLRGSPCR